MRTTWLGLGLTLALVTLTGCGDDEPPADPGPFEAEGNWLYLGPSDVPHTLTITRTSMKYADVDGMWSSSWKIKAFDNALHRFQVELEGGVGSYLPMGQSMSGAYAKADKSLTVQLANGSSYPELKGAGSCIDSASSMPLPECRLYVVKP